MLMGDTDFLLKVVTSDVDAYEEFLRLKLVRLPAVGGVRSNMALTPVKESTALPLERLLQRAAAEPAGPGARPASSVAAASGILVGSTQLTGKPMQERYEPAVIEAEAQRDWEARGAFAVTEDPARPKYYCLCMFRTRAGVCTWATCATTPSATC